MSLPIDLPTIWFMLVGILFAGYAMLDGFDLGVGILHLINKDDTGRRLQLNSIGPVWDGNEVWLVTGGGALFAAFPEVYATVFSGFYLAFILLLFALLFRAVAIEFRSKQPMRWWRQMWDIGFTAGSFLSSFLIGVAIGNIAWGINLDSHYEYAGTLLDLLHPYALWMGVTTVALFAMHGCIYLVLKTEGDLQKRIRGWVNNTIITFIMCYAIASFATMLYVPHMVKIFRDHPIAGALALANMFAIANIPREIHHGRNFFAFISSCVTMITLMGIFGLGMYPNLVVALPDAGGSVASLNSLTIYNSSSSMHTLGIMLIVALMGVPLVLAYTVSIYWIFRGKVKLEAHSY